MNNEFEKKKFMDNLIQNPSLLFNFSVDRLKVILDYYQKEIERKRKLIKKMNG